MHEPQPVDQVNVELFVSGMAGPCLLEFWAPWCAPCLAMATAVRGLMAEMRGTLRVGRVDIEHSPTVAARFGIVGTPTLVLLVHGQPVAQVAGFLQYDELKLWVRKALEAAGHHE